MQLKRIVIIAGVAVLPISFLVSLGDVTRYGGADLRNKVVGARIFLLNLDPYRHEFNETLPDSLLDPLASPNGLTRVTVPPTVLFLHASLSWLPYRFQRLTWFFLEWAALICATYLLARTVPDQRARLLFLLSAIVFFCGGFFWRLHLERGQYYVFLLLLFSLAGFYLLRKPRKQLAAGLALGMAAAMRPSYLVMVVTLLLLHRNRVAVTMLAGALGFVILTLPFTGLNPWQSYLQAMPVHEQNLLNNVVLPPYTARGFPSVIEGADFSQMLPARSWNGTVVGTFLLLRKKLPGILPDLNVATLSKILGALFLVGYFSLLWSRGNDRGSEAFPLLASVIAALDVDYFLPVRWGYMDILLLAPLGLFMANECEKPIHSKLFVLILFALICTHTDFVPGASAIRNLAVMGALNFWVCWSALNNHKQLHPLTD